MVKKEGKTKIHDIICFLKNLQNSTEEKKIGTITIELIKLQTQALPSHGPLPSHGLGRIKMLIHVRKF